MIVLIPYIDLLNLSWIIICLFLRTIENLTHAYITYIVKLGFIGVYIIFPISAQKHSLWVLVRTASARRFSRVLTIYVLSSNMKKIKIFT